MNQGAKLIPHLEDGTALVLSAKQDVSFKQPKLDRKQTASVGRHSCVLMDVRVAPGHDLFTL